MRSLYIIVYINDIIAFYLDNTRIFILKNHL